MCLIFRLLTVWCLCHSQWDRFLDVTQAAMARAGFSYVRLKGTAQQQAQALTEFRNDPRPTTLLLSLKKGSAAGLTLTEACAVYLLEPHVNPATEDQAIGRVHRIGQTRPTVCVRLIMKDTIEQHIVLTRQSKKGHVVKKSNEAWSQRTNEVDHICLKVYAHQPPLRLYFAAGVGHSEYEAPRVVSRFISRRISSVGSSHR